MIDEFEELYDGFKFVESQDNLKITLEIFRTYTRNIPIKKLLEVLLNH